MKALLGFTTLLLLVSQTLEQCDKRATDDGKCVNECSDGMRLELPPEMNSSNCSGSHVVEKVMDLIQQSGIFPNDGYTFTRRIAYVETKDGTAFPENQNNSNECKERKGIWGITKTMMITMGESLQNLQEYNELNDVMMNICNVFGINITARGIDLKHPLVSGIAAHLYLHYMKRKNNTQALPSDVCNQASFWVDHYNTRNNATNLVFKERVMELEGCKVNADIVFVLDISASISQLNVNRMIDFVGRFVQNLTIGPHDDRVGVVLFGTNAHEIFGLSTYQNRTDLLNGIESLKTASENIRITKQKTNITEGLLFARKNFDSDRHPAFYTALRIAIVVSDGKTHNISNSVKEAEKLRNATPPVQIFTVGVGGNIREEEMIRIAGDRRRFTKLSGFIFNVVEENYLQDLCCREMMKLGNNNVTDGCLNKSEIIRYERIIPINGLTIKICTQIGQVALALFSSIHGEPENNLIDNLQCASSINNSCICMEAYMNGSSHRRESETTTLDIHITIEGMDNVNVFTMDFTDGDADTDCVGQELADDCPEDVDHTSTTPNIIGLPPTTEHHPDSGQTTINPSEEGSVTISGGISLTENSDLSFSLTCISTGGPATTVTWTRDSTIITEGTETVLNDSVTATYTHTLVAIQRGEYSCSVANNKPSSDTACGVVDRLNPPTILTSLYPVPVIILPINATAVKISWTSFSLPLKFRYSSICNLTGVVITQKTEVFPTGVNTVNVTLDDEFDGYEHKFSLQYITCCDLIHTPVIEEDFTFDKQHFQIQFGPIDYCLNWEVDGKLASIEAQIQSRLIRVIRENCTKYFDLTTSFLRKGAFLCRGNPLSATYRSTLVNPFPNTMAASLVGIIQNWVCTRPSVILDGVIVRVNETCPTAISSLDEEECDGGGHVDPALSQRITQTLSICALRELGEQIICRV